MGHYQPPEKFLLSGNHYYLLPFSFADVTSQKEVIVNELGDYILSDIGTSQRIITRNVSPEDPLFADLCANFFISTKPVPDLMDVITVRYGTKKAFLDSFTSLHIFVLTLRCTNSCRYCQVSRRTSDEEAYDIRLDELDNAIGMMLKTPSKDITMEFQGGEPLLAFNKLKYAVLRTKERNRDLPQKKNITFVVCTNLMPLNDEILAFCFEHGIYISTSYDGPDYIHNYNRPITGRKSHDCTLRAINRCRDYLGQDRVSVLMTTTALSLGYPRQIVDDYIEHGFYGIFIRELNPYGYAIKQPEIMYSTLEFLKFYKEVLLYILELNKNGIFFMEEYAAIILKKILTPFPVGFTDLQSPAGIINSVIVYNYDGNVYCSDESRMLAEEGDKIFCLGSLKSNTYEEIFHGEKAKSIAELWANETLPGCSDCAFRVYCGADPIRNYTTQKDMVGYRPDNSFCLKNREIIRFIFELLLEKENEKIFFKWVNR